MKFDGIEQASGLMDEERDDISRLVRVLTATNEKNALRSEYYLGHQGLKNIGIAVPKRYKELDIACSWASKAVDVLAARSQFEGFDFSEEVEDTNLHRIVSANALGLKYEKAVTTELTHCCSFITLDRDTELGVRVMFHSAETSAALWNGARDRIRCGIALVDKAPMGDGDEEYPKQVNYYSDEKVIEITREDDAWKWHAVAKPHIMGRPLMEPMAYRASEARPFGVSRINRHVRAIVDEYMRVQLRKSVAGEVSTIVQKYIIGASEDDFDQTKYDTAIGHILLLGRDEEGEVPSVGQFAAASVTPHIEQERSLAGAFASATSIPMSALISDYANPMSADAMYAANENLVIEAEALNRGNRRALNNVAMMIMAIDQEKPLSELTDAERTVWAKFANPAAPSIVSLADAAVKVNSAAPWYSETPQFWDDLGKSRQERDELLDAKRRLEARSMIRAQQEQAAEGSQEGGLDDTRNFYRIMSIVKDFNRGAYSKTVAVRMMKSLGIDEEEARNILESQDEPLPQELPVTQE